MRPPIQSETTIITILNFRTKNKFAIKDINLYYTDAKVR